jgi:DNA-binding transcriptional ArsR family regulator
MAVFPLRLKRMPASSESLDLMFGALADPVRRAVLSRLARGMATVSELAEVAGVSLPAIAPHLLVLEASGFIHSSKAGRVRTCRLEPRRLDAAQVWIELQRAAWETRFGE